MKSMFHKVFGVRSFVCYVAFGKWITLATQRRTVSSDPVIEISCKSKGIKMSFTSLTVNLKKKQAKQTKKDH